MIKKETTQAHRSVPLQILLFASESGQTGHARLDTGNHELPSLLNNRSIDIPLLRLCTGRICCVGL